MERLQKLQSALETSKVDAMLISVPENRRYLSGFTGSAGVLVVGVNQAFLITDFRYWEQATAEAAGFDLYKQGSDLHQSIAELVIAQGWHALGFESEGLTYDEYQKLRALLPDTIVLKPLPGLVRKQRAIKSQAEIELLAEAAHITDRAWEQTLTLIRPGVREDEVALEFDYQLRRNGAEGSAFTTIVASGQRAALPHGVASAKVIETGDLVILDGGARYRGYHADLTRTVVVGKATPKQREIYQIVLEAQLLALNALQAGLTGRQVDAVARDYIKARGYGEYFGHGLGHSVGLAIHENPRLSPTEEAIIPVGATITVEPGIYLPDWGGVRIEDLVAVGRARIRNLTGSPKDDLIEV